MAWLRCEFSGVDVDPEGIVEKYCRRLLSHLVTSMQKMWLVVIIRGYVYTDLHKKVLPYLVANLGWKVQQSCRLLNDLDLGVLCIALFRLRTVRR